MNPSQCRQVHGGFFLIKDWCGSAFLSLEDAIPGQVFLCGVRNPNKHCMRRNPGSSLGSASGPAFWLLPRLCSCPNFQGPASCERKWTYSFPSRKCPCPSYWPRIPEGNSGFSPPPKWALLLEGYGRAPVETLVLLGITSEMDLGLHGKMGLYLLSNFTSSLKGF